MSAEKVRVVVVTYQSAQVLPGLVDTLPAGMQGLDWHLVVVDNASSDQSLELAGSLVPAALLVQTGRNAGYAAGINAGLAAPGDYTAAMVLNADVRLAPGCVAELLRALRTPGTGIAVPRLADGSGALNQSMRRAPSLGRELLETVFGAQRLGRIADVGAIVVDPEKYREEQTTDWAEGSTQLISRECLDACGVWDESFFLFSEETEFGLRAGEGGFATRFVPAAHAIHLEGGSVDDPAKWALLCRNKIRLYRRRHGRLSSFAYHACIVVREASRGITGRATSRAALRVLLSRKRFSTPAGPGWLAADFGSASPKALQRSP